MRISFLDIRNAYVNRIPERPIYMMVPKEVGLSHGTVARQVRCVCGPRDVGKIWEDTGTQVLEAMEFIPGASNPCILSHRTKDLSIVVHGGDFTTLGTDAPTLI